MSIKEKQDRLPTLFWLPKLHKRPYKARFITNSSSCTTTVLSKLLTLCLAAVKTHWIRYYDTVYERDGINYFWSIKKMFSINLNLKTFRLSGFLFLFGVCEGLRFVSVALPGLFSYFFFSKLSTYDFSTLYTTLPNQLIKDKLFYLINQTFIRENT